MATCMLGTTPMSHFSRPSLMTRQENLLMSLLVMSHALVVAVQHTLSMDIFRRLICERLSQMSNRSITGGHTMEQQRATITQPWQLVAPGGIFVMEDLLTSYMPMYGGGPN